MTGIELNMVVTDSVKALELYEKIFDGIKRIEVTSFEKGLNEVVFLLYDMRIHMLDENPPFGLLAPQPGAPQSMWSNVFVPDIKNTFRNALDAGCTEVFAINDMVEIYGVMNAMFADPFGYVWMLHEVVREVSFEDRVNANKETNSGENI